MGRFLIRVRQLILVIGDLILLYASLYLALMVRYLQIPSKDHLTAHVTPFSILFALWIIGFFINKLYDLPEAKNEIQFFKRLLQAMGMNFLVGMSFFYLIPFFQITPKTNLVIAIVIFTAFELVWRSIFNALIAPRAFLNRTLFIGNIEALPELKYTLDKKSGLGYSLVAVLDPKEGSKESLKKEGITCYQDISRVRSVVTIDNIHTVVLGPEFIHNEAAHKELFELVFWGIEITDWARLYEALLGRVPVHILTEEWFWANLREGSKKWYDAARTAIDVALALLVLAALGVMLPFVALGIWVESGRPVFYAQKRIGAGGKPFLLYKLRSMIKLHPDGSAEQGAPEFTKEKDERITGVGRFIRAVRIDEMPQAFNVLRREMNFIGPRPERPEFVERLKHEMPYFIVRHLVKPGITGWAQVNKPLHSSLKENLVKLEYDLYYIKNRSLLLDLVILLRTFNIILRGIGR